MSTQWRVPQNSVNIYRLSLIEPMLWVPFMEIILITCWNMGSCNGAIAGNSETGIWGPCTFASIVLLFVTTCPPIFQVNIHMGNLLCIGFSKSCCSMLCHVHLFSFFFLQKSLRKFHRSFDSTWTLLWAQEIPHKGAFCSTYVLCYHSFTFQQSIFQIKDLMCFNPEYIEN